jgi:hypothetical protein
MIKSTIVLLGLFILFIPWYFTNDPPLAKVNELITGIEIIVHFSMLFLYYWFFKIYEKDKPNKDISYQGKSLAFLGLIIAIGYTVLGVLYNNAISESEKIIHVLDIGYALCDIYVAFLLFFTLDFISQTVLGRKLYGHKRKKE